VQRKSHYRHAATLQPGYYLLSVRPNEDGKAGSLFFEREGGSLKETEVQFKEPGSMLLCLRAPTTIGVGEKAGTVLDYTKLGAVRTAYAKIVNRARLKHRIPMLDEAGYVCILSGVEDPANLPRMRKEAIALRAFVRFRLDDDSVVNPRLFDNPVAMLPAPETPWRPSVASQGKIGVALHLYYTDLWPEFAIFLNTIKRPFDLWITHCGMDGALHDRIIKTFPQAQLVQVENRGRDIWPFVSLLNAGAFDLCDAICKIHSKKTLHGSGSEEALLGSRWRRRVLYDLLAFGRADMIAGKFEQDPGLGMLGPRSLRVPNDRCTLRTAWGSDQSREKTLEIAGRMDAPMDDGDLDFFAGSMFWAKGAALGPLRRLGLRREDFPGEQGQVDGTTHHALERLFTRSAQKAGFTVGDVPAVTVEKSLALTRLGDPFLASNRTV
jgi:rhamnan synthesis protein F